MGFVTIAVCDLCSARAETVTVDSVETSGCRQPDGWYLVTTKTTAPNEKRNALKRALAGVVNEVDSICDAAQQFTKTGQIKGANNKLAMSIGTLYAYLAGGELDVYQSENPMQLMVQHLAVLTQDQRADLRERIVDELEAEEDYDVHHGRVLICQECSMQRGAEVFARLVESLKKRPVLE